MEIEDGHFDPAPLCLLISTVLSIGLIRLNCPKTQQVFKSGLLDFETVQTCSHLTQEVKCFSFHMENSRDSLE